MFQCHSPKSSHPRTLPQSPKDCSLHLCLFQFWYPQCVCPAMGLLGHTLPTKFRLVKAMVFPVVMYGCESWTVKKAERRRIDGSSGGHGQPPPREPASASRLHLPLSRLLFQPQQCVSGGMGHYFQELAKKKHQGTKHLLKMQNQHGGHALYQDVQKPCQDDWGKNPGCNGDHPSHGEEPGPSPFGSARPGFSPCRLNLCDFLERHALGKQVKLIKKMGATWNNLCRLAGPQARLGE